MKWIRQRSLGCDDGMQMIARMWCWSAGRGDYWEVISNEREVRCMNDQSIALRMPMVATGTRTLEKVL